MIIRYLIVEYAVNFKTEILSQGVNTIETKYFIYILDIIVGRTDNSLLDIAIYSGELYSLLE